MNYKKQYVALIRKSQKRLTTKYTEKHHIFPKSIFGENSFIICLTAKEHYIAHLLLWKYYKKNYGTKDGRTQRMCYAFYLMCNVSGKKYSRQYSKAREDFSFSLSIRYLGQGNPMFGKLGDKHPSFGTHKTKEAKEKMRERKLLVMNPVERIDPNTGEIKEYESIKSVEKDGFKRNRIYDCLNGRCNKHQGYFWNETSRNLS